MNVISRIMRLPGGSKAEPQTLRDHQEDEHQAQERFHHLQLAAHREHRIAVQLHQASTSLMVSTDSLLGMLLPGHRARGLSLEAGTGMARELLTTEMRSRI